MGGREGGREPIKRVVVYTTTFILTPRISTHPPTPAHPLASRVVVISAGIRRHACAHR